MTLLKSIWKLTTTHLQFCVHDHSPRNMKHVITKRPLHRKSLIAVVNVLILHCFQKSAFQRWSGCERYYNNYLRLIDLNYPQFCCTYEYIKLMNEWRRHIHITILFQWASFLHISLTSHILEWITCTAWKFLQSTFFAFSEKEEKIAKECDGKPLKKCIEQLDKDIKKKQEWVKYF